MKKIIRSESINLSKKKWIIIYSVAIFVFSVIAIAALGPTVAPDTATYENFGENVPPLYPIFLWICRRIFRVGNYHYGVCVIQAVFLSVASVVLLNKLIELFHLEGIMMYAVSAIVMIYTLFPIYIWTGFKANQILTEGLSYPLYMLFFGYIAAAVCKSSIKDWGMSLLMAALLLLVRDQMRFIFVVLIFAAIIICLIDKKSIVRLLIFCLIALGAYRCVGFCEDIYHRQVGKDAGFHTIHVAFAFMPTSIYISDAADKDWLNDKEAKEIFAQIYNKTYEQKQNFSFSGRGLWPRADYYTLNHDMMNLSINAVFDNYFLEKGNMDEAEQLEFKGKIMQEINRVMVRKNFDKWLILYTSLCFSGMIRALALSRSHVIAFFIYAIVFLLAFYVRNKDKRLFRFVLTSVVIILGDVASVSLVIMPIFRYVFYCSIGIYLSFFLLIAYVLKDKKIFLIKR